MTEDRADPFSSIDIAEFVKPKPAPAPISRQGIRDVSEAAGFPSRAPAVRQQRRRRRISRNVQFNMKLDQASIDRFREIADRDELLFGELFEQMLDAYEQHRP